MTDYIKSTSFASKDALLTGNPLKIVKGTEIDTEFNNIQTASLTKADLLSPTFTGVPLAPTAVLGTSTTQLATTAFATAISPSGLILMWPTATVPSGFLLCAGAAVSRTTYAALFAVVGVVFGIGDGSTTFNLPDYRDRSPVGAGTTYAAATTGGSKDAVVVSHTHTGTTAAASLTGSLAQGGNPTVSGVFSAGGSFTGVGQNTQPNYLANFDATHSHTITTNTTGVSGINANLPPYLGIYFIIKT